MTANPTLLLPMWPTCREQEYHPEATLQQNAIR
jgi:hypothetical protein